MIKVLYLSHGHPEIQIGGAELYAYELFCKIRQLQDFEPTFVARTLSFGRFERRDTPFRPFESRSDEILWCADREGFDWFYKTRKNRRHYSVHFRELLEILRPDVVHIQHLDGIGLGVIRQIRNTRPSTAIVYTLHELQAICNANGLMIRPRQEDTLCEAASPKRCHECFPEISSASFFLRERVQKSQLQWVDQFLAPSQFVVDRYVHWGIPKERIRLEDIGRISSDFVAADTAQPKVGSFAFFGQISPHKGLLVVLKAAQLLLQSNFRKFHISLHGAQFETQQESFRREFQRRLDAVSSHVTFAGEYHNSAVGDLMSDNAWILVPSTWWENSPLVIQEAFLHRRPVICSNIGGMAEKITDQINGLHFEVGDAESLARTIQRAASSTHLWKTLRQGIDPIYSLEETVEFHSRLYRRLIGEKRATRAAC